MSILDAQLRQMELVNLDQSQAQLVRGGDRFSEDVFRAAGFLWQTTRNLVSAYAEFLAEHPHPNVYV